MAVTAFGDFGIANKGKLRLRSPISLDASDDKREFRVAIIAAHGGDEIAQVGFVKLASVFVGIAFALHP